MSADQLQHLFVRFVLEVHKQSEEEYPLLHLCSGLVCHRHANGHSTLDIFKDTPFAQFRTTLDAEMK